MKTIKKITVALAFASLSLVAVGCNVKKPLSGRVENFAVAAQETVEIGQYYTPDMPAATLDGKKAVVAVSATQNGKDLFFNGNNALLVEDFADVTLTYTIAEGSEKLEKSTVLKVQDTIAPYIVTSTLPSAVYRGETFEYADYIRIGDLSGTVSESSITVTDQNGNAIETENGAFILPENSPVTEITISVMAKDGKNNLAEKQVKLPVLDNSLWNKPFDFKNLNIDKVYAKTTGSTATAIEKDGAQAVKISRSTDWTGKTTYTQAFFTLPESVMEYTCFDYIKLTIGAKTNCDLQVYKASGANAIKRGADGMQTQVAYFDMSLVKEGNANVINGEKLVITLATLESRITDSIPETLEFDFYVYDIEFGYYEREVVFDKPIDTTAFGIEADEVLSALFTPDGGEAETVNLSSWIPKNGTLTITLKKQGYVTTTVEIPIVTVMSPIGDETETENDNDVEFNW